MGVGLGFAIAAAVLQRGQGTGQRVVCVEGDSAFGFSGMEVETMCRLAQQHTLYCTESVHIVSLLAWGLGSIVMK